MTALEVQNSTRSHWVPFTAARFHRAGARAPVVFVRIVALYLYEPAVFGARPIRPLPTYSFPQAAAESNAVSRAADSFRCPSHVRSKLNATSQIVIAAAIPRLRLRDLTRRPFARNAFCRPCLSLWRGVQAGLLQKAAEMSRNIPWEETLTVCDVPLELEDVHDDLKRCVVLFA